jgi:hypothetical protein
MENNNMSIMQELLNKKTMSFKNFIDRYCEYETGEEQNNFLVDIMEDNEYIPYALKVSLADYVINNANISNEAVHFNSVKEKILYISLLFLMYTCVNNDDFDYDELVKTGIDIEHFIYQLGRTNPDSVMFNKIFEQRKVDFEKNNNLVKFNYNDITDAVYVGILKGIDYGIDAISKTINSEEFKEMLAGLSE